MKRYQPGPVWFFDLDNTLHDASTAIFPAIAANMNAFISGVLGNAAMPQVQAAANAARLHYTRRYGAALLGMVLHHQVRAADFLHAAHQFDDLHSMISSERGLARLLAALPGRKILLTNAPRRYSSAVMRHLKLKKHFSSHVAIESMTVFRHLRPKPARSLLRKMAAREGVKPARCILVEDTVANLKAARAVGMRTAWITGYLAAPPATPGLLRKRPLYVDLKLPALGGLRRRASVLLR
ncbi:MAG: HAD-IA family hydrolase [Janthinobacterium lividum]